MLEFSEKFTIDSSSFSAADLQALRDAGFTEKEVLDVVLACGYRHYITRIADATGVDLDAAIATDEEITAAYSYERAAQLDAADMTEAQRAVIETKASGSGMSGKGPWSVEIDESDLPAETQAVFARWRDEHGFVPAYLRAITPHARAVVTADAFQRGVTLGASGLGRWREDAIAVLVSVTTRCPSFAVFYGEMLHRHAGSAEAVLEVLNWRHAQLDEADRAILAFAEQMTLDCSQITQEWTDRLRGHGLKDEEILDIIVETAFLNCFVRVANALGVPPDAEMMRNQQLAEALISPP